MDPSPVGHGDIRRLKSDGSITGGPQQGGGNIRGLGSGGSVASGPRQRGNDIRGLNNTDPSPVTISTPDGCGTFE
ncbi:hypothetical protein E2562_034458 [Oryza meyeriana var. granulata]|uniref:Uncharacterized protein n=1 Tax=Oryza meyeriana var. granulata TaxID=110450 RepID=A0A6G1CWT2_9ORYZ|nr:hypothetical protein E2562_034458 [Oryza meyeriana var. granulata]